MNITTVAQEIEDLSRRSDLPYLSGACVHTLVAMLMQEVEAHPGLPPPVRGALIGTAAVIAKHGRDCATMEALTAQLLERMGRPDVAGAA